MTFQDWIKRSGLDINIPIDPEAFHICLMATWQAATREALRPPEPFRSKKPDDWNPTMIRVEMPGEKLQEAMKLWKRRAWPKNRITDYLDF